MSDFVSDRFYYFDFQLFQVDWISICIEKMTKNMWSPILYRGYEEF